jgi:hypothetical protein
VVLGMLRARYAEMSFTKGVGMLFWILIILLVVLLVAAVPTWPYSSGWGYSPAGVLAVILLVLLVLWLTGVIEFNADANGNPALDVTPRASR